MKRLYTGFIVTILTFMVLSGTLQFVWWKWGDNANGMFKRDRLQLLNIKHTRRQHQLTVSSTTSTSTTFSSTKSTPKSEIFVRDTNSDKNRILESFKNEVSIWDTSSDKDRILEQIKYIPISLKQSSAHNQRHRIILVSNSPKDWGKKKGNASFLEDKCLVNNCFLVGNEYEEKVDAILFGQGIQDIHRYTSNIHKETVKIFFSLESPVVTGPYFNIEKYINWTATYRRDSTIVAPYERFSIFRNASDVIKLKKKTPKNFASRKTKMAAIFVSNCKTVNERMEIVNELQTFIDVDVYGVCGNFTCFRSRTEECFNLLNENYKFYLAFENANCRDYITEKFFVNGLGNDIIPVVMGAHPDDYRKVAPPLSYIHLEDFPSIKALAAYMKEVDENDALYNTYFQWKETGSFINTKFWCRLCSMLNDDKKPTLVVDNLEQWWHPGDVCVPHRWIPVET